MGIDGKVRVTIGGKGDRGDSEWDKEEKGDGDRDKEGRKRG